MKSRREFIRDSILLTSVMGTLSYGCSDTQKKGPPEDPCKDLSSLTEADRSVRLQLGYIEQSSFADRNCANCNLFVKPDETLPCGNCLVMKGPVADNGYCTVWAPV